MKYTLPADIERRSFTIISEELRRRGVSERDPLEEAILTRIIHTTADFDFAENLMFTRSAAEIGRSVLQSGAAVITDTNMAMTGINKKLLEKYGSTVRCFIADEDVALAAKVCGTTRAAAAVDKAAECAGGALVFAVGNAPTALIRIHELVRQGRLAPRLVIAVPVGFVNVVESKELFFDAPFPCIIAKGRKGGSAVAAAIINALLCFS
ncbi:MAG: precorrin-8X methylmutase [Spirochaetaceae bacterium]|jgi:precorrin-8X/cobalt-precorrin-8 methylmutase|nr:precorrin-8X methylmutase [Spirochaetaceae bacterium]